MMIFSFHMAFGILLIALAAGLALFFKAQKHESGFGKVLAILIVLFAIVHLGCTSYYGYSFWKKGYYDMPMMSMKPQQPMMMGNKGMPMNKAPAQAPATAPAPKQ